MIDLKNLRRAIEQIAEEKGIDAAKILEAVESSIAAAYKKEYEKKGELVKSKFDLRTGDMKFWLVKTVVDETTVRMPDEDEAADGESRTAEAVPAGSGRPSGDGQENDEEALPRYNADRHILVDEARKTKKDAALGDELEFPLETHEDFGRIAAQTAKQVILQKLREAERESIFSEFKSREGEIVSGIVQRFERGGVIIELGRAMGIMYQNEAVPGEHYRPGDRMKFLITAIQENTRGPGIVLSRAHPKFVSKLFSLEVPEIADGVVEIKSIAREPGSRTKLAVATTDEGIDPVGACVGQRGTRVMAVSNELGQEKIDIVEWSEDPVRFITNALSPAKAKNIEIIGDREANAFIDEGELSLAIGKGGQNVRLAARLTGWKIDIRSLNDPDAVRAEAPAEEGAETITAEEKPREVESPEAEEKPEAPPDEAEA